MFVVMRWLDASSEPSGLHLGVEVLAVKLLAMKRHR